MDRIEMRVDMHLKAVLRFFECGLQVLKYQIFELSNLLTHSLHLDMSCYACSWEAYSQHLRCIIAPN